MEQVSYLWNSLDILTTINISVLFCIYHVAAFLWINFILDAVLYVEKC